MPNHAQSNLQSLDTLLTGMPEPLASHLPVIQDDSWDTLTGDEPSVEEPGDLDWHVFRLLHVEPKRQKSMKSSSSEIRQDHCAVSLYKIISKNNGTFEVKVASRVNSAHAAVKVISLDDFLKIGPVKLKGSFGVAAAAPGVEWAFEDCALPSECMTQLGTDFITSAMNAEAYPGPFNLFKFDLAKQSSAMRTVVKQFVDAKMMEEMVPGSFQMTPLGYDKVMYRLVLTDFQRFFHRRKVDVNDFSTWELMDLLGKRGWKPSVPPFRKQLLPLSLEADEVPPEQRVWYFGSALDVGRPYLLCLCQLDVVRTRGPSNINGTCAIMCCCLCCCLRVVVANMLPCGMVPGHKEICHRKTLDYYLELLGMPVRAQKRKILDDRPGRSQKPVVKKTKLKRDDADDGVVKYAVEDGYDDHDDDDDDGWVDQPISDAGSDDAESDHSHDDTDRDESVVDVAPDALDEGGESPDFVLPHATPRDDDNRSVADSAVDPADREHGIVKWPSPCPPGFKSFTFRLVTRSVSTQWECTCPYHKIDGEPPCRKTMTEDGTPNSRAVVLRALKSWCIEGRTRPHRNDTVNTKLGHKQLQPSKCPILEDDELDRRVLHYMSSGRCAIWEGTDKADAIDADGDKADKEDSSDSMSSVSSSS